MPSLARLPPPTRCPRSAAFLSSTPPRAGDSGRRQPRNARSQDGGAARPATSRRLAAAAFPFWKLLSHHLRGQPASSRAPLHPRWNPHLESRKEFRMLSLELTGGQGGAKLWSSFPHLLRMLGRFTNRDRPVLEYRLGQPAPPRCYVTHIRTVATSAPGKFRAH